MICNFDSIGWILWSALSFINTIRVLSFNYCLRVLLLMEFILTFQMYFWILTCNYISWIIAKIPGIFCFYYSQENVVWFFLGNDWNFKIMTHLTPYFNCQVKNLLFYASIYFLCAWLHLFFFVVFSRWIKFWNCFEEWMVLAASVYD